MTAYTQNVAHSAVHDATRMAFLRKVGLWTAGGLGIAAVTSIVSMFTLAAPVMEALGGRGLSLLVFGLFMFAHVVARAMVLGKAKVAGFILGTAAEGVALGFLLLITVLLAGSGAEGLLVIGQAMALTFLSAVGMLAYVWFTPSDFSKLKAALSMLSLPLFGLMAISVFMPVGGTLGLLICLVFVAVSIASLLHQLNEVIHEYDDTMHIEGGFELSMALLVVLWNLISLLNRARR